MTKVRIEALFTCDRCGAEDKRILSPQDHRMNGRPSIPRGWVFMGAALEDTPRNELDATVCGDCFNAFKRWLAEGSTACKTPAEAPASTEAPS